MPVLPTPLPAALLAPAPPSASIAARQRRLIFRHLHEQLVRMVKENEFDLAEALSYVTSNPADALQLSRKGRLQEGMDADIVLLDKDLAIDTVIARGQLMMKDKQLRVRGTYE